MFYIIHIIGGAVVLTKIKLRFITVQVLLATVLVHPLHASLKDAVEAIKRDRVVFGASIIDILS